MVHVGLEETAFATSGTELGYPCTEHGLGVELLPLFSRNADFFNLLDVVTGSVKWIQHNECSFLFFKTEYIVLSQLTYKNRLITQRLT